MNERSKSVSLFEQNREDIAEAIKDKLKSNRRSGTFE